MLLFKFLKNMKYLYILLLFFINSLIFSNDITVSVFDKDLDIPLEGVKLTVNKIDNSYFTDFDGQAKIHIDNFDSQVILVAYLIGYEVKRIILKKTDTNVVVKMGIEGVLEGKELVIEEKAIGKKDEKSGVSTVVDKGEIKSSAMIGPVEDVMTVIKALPGVSYTGKFSSRPSVRGGHPSEVTATLDGFLVRFPYHWGSAFSIFNPNIIDSVKFSNGIFSAKYGSAMSGLIEVNSLTPDQGLKIDGIFSTTTTEFFLQTPLWKNSGLFIGGRITYLDLTLLLLDFAVTNEGAKINPAPYIRDVSFKWFWKPTQTVEWYINFFFGSDGVGMVYKNPHIDETEKINTYFDFENFKYDLFVVTGVKFLPHDRVFVHILTGYEWLNYGTRLNMTENGTTKYTDKFIQKYPFVPIAQGKDTFNVRNLESHMFETYSGNSIQSRFDIDFTLHEKVLFSVGGGITYDNLGYKQGGELYSFFINKDSTNDLPNYIPMKLDTNITNNNVFNSFGYLNFDFKIIPNTFDIELGCRIDHFAMFGKNVAVNTYPVANPRLMINYTPIKNLKYLDSVTFSWGVGLFSKIPIESSIIEEKYGLRDFDISQPKSLTAITGVEFNLPLDFKLKIEGYYKYYFDRFYFNNDMSSTGETKFIIHNENKEIKDKNDKPFHLCNPEDFDKDDTYCLSCKGYKQCLDREIK